MRLYSLRLRAVKTLAEKSFVTVTLRRLFLVLIFSIQPVEAWTGVSADAVRKPVKSILEMRQEHVVLQQWELSCAAAALATILRYQYGEPVTERSVALGLISREEYLNNPDLVRLRQGFSLLDLKRYVEKIGYQGIGFGDMTLADLFARAPLIVPINLQGYPHFVVFRGGSGNTIVLADPAFGNVTVSKEKFVDGWIEYRELGRVGFVVMKDGSLFPPGRLAVSDMDFVIVR